VTLVSESVVSERKSAAVGRLDTQVRPPSPLVALASAAGLVDSLLGFGRIQPMVLKQELRAGGLAGALKKE
jgi:hypothetical protein